MSEEITTTETAREVVATALAFSTEDRAGMVKLFNALNSADSLNDANVQQLTLQGVIVQVGTRVDPATGEVSTCEFTTFITEDNAYFSQSDGIARSAKNLIAAFGKDFTSEPITIEFAEKKLQGGRSLKYFFVL